MATGTGDRPDVLVLCDDELLGEVIALCLRDCALEKRPLSAAPPSHAAPPPSYDLIVLAAGASRVEPLVALARASLLGCVGVTPLLVISRHPFEPDAASGIYHVSFPFDAAELRRKVQRLAQGAPQA